MRFPALLFLLAATGTPLPAWGADVEFCVKYAMDLTDASTSLGDDYLTSNADRPAAGALFQVIRNSDDVVVFNDHLSTGSLDAGCATLAVDTWPTTYRLKVISTAEVNGNTIKVWNNDSDEHLYAYQVASWTYLGVPVELVTPPADHWRDLAVATSALQRSNAGLSGKNLIFYTQACPTYGGSCVRDHDGSSPAGLRTYLCPSATCPGNAFTKTLIAHEMGHQVAAHANSGQRTGAADTITVTGGCQASAYDGGSHGFNTEENQVVAADEGLAHFWAVYAYNDEAESDCRVDFYGIAVDWNNDGSGSGDLDIDQVSCQGLPSWGLDYFLGIDGADYHGDICGGMAAAGNEFDWMRFYWDLVAVEDMPVEDLFAIWDDSDPDTWDTGGSDAADRLLDAAGDNGWQDAWDDQATANGTWR